jgi:uncharacterized protein (TIGR04222 family)
MNTELWQRIEAYNTDLPVSDYTFSTRLARENYWTRQFTEKAILEYKKFMYLAATADGMVSPSPVVDAVWHQHLIFTQSYQEFCQLLGKRIEHVPSTRNPEEAEKFRQAKKRTQLLYTETFGKQPADCWHYPDMYASLSLEKARMKLRAFLLWGILGFVLLIVPAYFTLGLVYPQIDSPYFLIAYLLLIAAVFGGMHLYNRNRLSNWISNLPPDSFLMQLKPSEVIYLRDRSVPTIIQHEINELVRKGIVQPDEKMKPQIIGTLNNPTLEEAAILAAIQEFPNTPLTVIFQRLRTKIIFMNPDNSMNAFLKYFHKSHFFGKLFRLNFCLLAALYLLGLTRLFTGIMRDKPIGLLAVLLVLLLAGIIYHLRGMQQLIGKKIIPDLYENKLVRQMEWTDRTEWQFFVLGNAAIVPALFPFIRHMKSDPRNHSDPGGSGCGSSCGSGCGSSCGGCGGCGS